MLDEVLAALATQSRTALHELASSDAPRTPGIYALWFEDTLLYVGISTKDPKDTTNPQAAGVKGRLDVYRRGRLTADFTLGCAFRFVVPSLSDEQRAGLAVGTMSIKDVQRLTVEWVKAHVTFSAVTADASTAEAAERIAHRRGLPGYPPPPFNSIRGT